MRSNSLQTGFTLLEVLVSSIILIGVISTISLSYRSALIASERADKNIQITGALPIILSKVSQGLKNQDKGETVLNGEGSTWGVSFKWDANLLQFKSAPIAFDIERGTAVTEEPRFRLWEVNLRVDMDNTVKTYKYNDVSWLDAKE